MQGNDKDSLKHQDSLHATELDLLFNVKQENYQCCSYVAVI